MVCFVLVYKRPTLIAPAAFYGRQELGFGSAKHVLLFRL